MNDTTRIDGFVLPDWLELIIRFLVGGAFVYAAFDKIAHPEAFARAISNYRILGDGTLHLMALYLPWLELVAGLGMILNFARRGAALLVGGMLLMFIAAIGWALARDLDISCGCFHTDGGHAVGLELLLRDVAMLAGAVALWACRGVRRSF